MAKCQKVTIAAAAAATGYTIEKIAVCSHTPTHVHIYIYPIYIFIYMSPVKVFASSERLSAQAVNSFILNFTRAARKVVAVIFRFLRWKNS